MTTRQPKYTYQLKITLKGAKPPIWRRVLVPSDMPLDRLHSVIQIAMGWFNCHLHQFVAFGRYFGAADNGLGADLDIEDETKIRLHDLLQMEKDSIVYEYDFGDSWEHKVTLEKILAYDEAQELPECIKGKRACPPEDCGGVWGYSKLLQVLADPADPEHDEMLEWLGGDIDPEAFDVRAVNFAFLGLRRDS